MDNTCYLATYDEGQFFFIHAIQVDETNRVISWRNILEDRIYSMSYKKLDPTKTGWRIQPEDLELTILLEKANLKIYHSWILDKGVLVSPPDLQSDEEVQDYLLHLNPYTVE